MRGHDYRIRGGGVAEPRFVIEPIGAEHDPFVLQQVQFYANLDHPVLWGRYLPNPAAEIAEVIVNNLRGQLLHVEMPEPLPDGWQPNPNRVD